MIVYSATKKQFSYDVQTNQIEKTILTSFVRELGHSTGKSEVRSWRDSMVYMNNVISDPEIPEDAGVAIEYKIPQTSKRIDFILTGLSETQKSTAILIELKQWSDGIGLSEKEGVLNSVFFGEVTHPSYQVWSYATLLQDFNSNVQDQEIELKPCAYLHNYEPDNIVGNERYQAVIDNAPVFFRPDVLKLQNFIKRFVKYGDKRDIIYQIENGKIRPSKALADSLASMLQGNREFVLIDTQKVVYETGLYLAKQATAEDKQVLIVEGGPGTGKSVVAINLLVELTKRGLVVQYTTRNSAPRKVYEAMLSGSLAKTRISNLFTSTGSFFDIAPNTFDVLVVDEAHRMTERSGMFSHLGENQVKELVSAAKLSVFFIDEDQQVTLKDIGSVGEIKKWAQFYGAKIYQYKLDSQFRCNGSDGYLAWVDNVLQINQTANDTLEDLQYDFQVFDDPGSLHEAIRERNEAHNKSRMLAGYCWKWVSKQSPSLFDIEIGDYKARWNLDAHGQAWIIQKDSVSEVGCIHTCQGLELEYAGVIIGNDFVIRDGRVVTNVSKRASTDKSISGFKQLMKESPDEALYTADKIIKNTYRTLLTRGMKGCYIYCTDLETQEYFKELVQNQQGKTSVYADIDAGISALTQ